MWPLCGMRLEERALWVAVEGQNVWNFPYPVRIRWSRQPNLVPFYLYNRIFECPENIRNDGFPDVRWSSRNWQCWKWHFQLTFLVQTRELPGDALDQHKT